MRAGMGDSSGGVCARHCEHIFSPPSAVCCASLSCVCVCVCFAYYTNAKHTHNTHTRDDVVVVGVVYNSQWPLWFVCAFAFIHSLFSSSSSHIHIPHWWWWWVSTNPYTNVVCVCVCVCVREKGKKKKWREHTVGRIAAVLCGVCVCMYVCLGGGEQRKYSAALLPLLLLLLHSLPTHHHFAHSAKCVSAWNGHPGRG